MHDVAVIGAGPCGSTAAFLLARAGMKVVVMEKEAVPGAKPCGGGLTARARSLLPFDPEGAIERACSSVLLHFNESGLSFMVEREAPFLFMVLRGKFDALCAREAQKAGAEFRFNAPVADPRDCRARFVIDASGAQGAADASIPGIVIEFPAEAGPGRAVPRFDFRKSVRGYGWLFPKGGGVSAGMVSHAGGGTNLRRELEHYLAFLGLTPPPDARFRGHRIPVRPRKRPVIDGRIFHAGDALGAADPLTAEGLSNAILTAKLCAEALLGGSPAETYAVSLKNQVYPELAAGRALSGFFYGLPTARDFIFRKTGRALCEKVADVFAGKCGYAGEMGTPGNYLKLLGGLLRSKGR